MSASRRATSPVQSRTADASTSLSAGAGGQDRRASRSAPSPAAPIFAARSVIRVSSPAATSAAAVALGAQRPATGAARWARPSSSARASRTGVARWCGGEFRPRLGGPLLQTLHPSGLGELGGGAGGAAPSASASSSSARRRNVRGVGLELARPHQRFRVRRPPRCPRPSRPGPPSRSTDFGSPRAWRRSPAAA